MLQLAMFVHLLYKAFASCFIMRKPVILNSIIAALGLLTFVGCAQTNQSNHVMDSLPMAGAELATLGAGCFWCVEAIFQSLDGVYKVESGYAGGTVMNPSYKEVCNGTTGHAEVVQVHFNPKVISFADILEVFWETHDPTTLNKQGADVGTQYRSAIFYHSEEQKRVAELAKSAADESGVWSSGIVTEISPFSNYFSAEGHHQDYYSSNSSQPYCSMVIAPKLGKFKKRFREKLKQELK
jgi:peptide-methionine (S)-S-oxide reductase